MIMMIIIRIKIFTVGVRANLSTLNRYLGMNLSPSCPRCASSSKKVNNQ